MALLLQDDFSNNADGPPGGADTGQLWVLTGAPVLGFLEVKSGLLQINDAGVNSYAQAVTDGVPDTIQAAFQFSGPGATVCLISHREQIFQGFNMGLHLVVTPDNLDVQLRESATTDGGPFESIMPGGVPYTFPVTMPFNFGLGMIITISGDTINVLAPDGSGHVCTDPRVSELIGHKFVVQSLRPDTSAGKGKWSFVQVSGPLGVPDEIPPPPTPGQVWRLVPLFEEEEHVLEYPSLRYRTRQGVTAYGAEAPLSTTREPSNEQLSSAFVFLGGHVHETQDPAVRDLWLDSGFEVETL